MNRKKRKWTIDLNAATAASSDGWIFAFTETDDGELEMECMDHPARLSGQQPGAADAIANEAADAFMDAMAESEAIIIENDGSEIRQTNFWESALAENGYVFVSVHEKTIRMLVPPSAEDAFLPEMKTGKSMLIEPGSLHEGSLDFVFDDGTDSPFRVVVDTWQIDGVIRPGKNIPFSVYTEKGKQLEFKAQVLLPKQAAKRKDN